MDTINLIHGEGGKHTQQLIKELFYKEFSNDNLLRDKDAAVLKIETNDIAFTTDSFVVNPLFFLGGDIGRLCISGTVNDLVTSFSIPQYISLSLIIEEGFSFKALNEIVASIKKTSEEAGVMIVTGDTKVVEKDKVDGIFINTSGIGMIAYSLKDDIKSGDKIILTSNIAEHGTAIASSRYGLEVIGDIKSDVTPLNDLISVLWDYREYIRLLKDPTRGGIAQCLNEIASKYSVGLNILEHKIPIRKEVKTLNGIIGLDPYYLASEGVMILIVEDSIAIDIVHQLNKDEKYKDATIIGDISEEHKAVILENSHGGRRILRELEGVMLPRIC